MSKINSSNEETILQQTKRLLTLCQTEENVSKQHVEVLLDTLRTFFQKYEDCLLPSIVWEVVDKIIILEGTIEEKKKIDVDWKTCIKLCEYVFGKLADYTNREWTDLVYVFSFNCLKRQLCSLINTLIHFNYREIRRKVEASFTVELIDLIRKMFENVKKEKDLEIKKFYAEFLWRSLRRVDKDFAETQNFNVKKQTIEKLKNFGMIKFDEVCINWLREENFMDKKSVIEKGSFTITADNNQLKKEFLLCYIGNCSLLLYFNNDEGDETCKLEIPYYHILSVQYKSGNNFDMECKAIVEQTNIFTLWTDYVKNSIDHEIISKFSVSLIFEKVSKEVNAELIKATKIVNDRISVKEKKKERVNSLKTVHSKKETNKHELNIIEKSKDCQDITSDSNSKDSLSNVETHSNIDKGNDPTINSFSTLLLKNKTRKRIDTLRPTEKRKKYTDELSKKNEPYFIKTEKNSDYKKNYDNDPLINDLDSKDDFCATNSIEKDSDTEMILQKIIACHKKKKEQFQANLKKSFADTLVEVNERIKALVEKQKNRREELRKKFEKRKNNIVTKAERDLTLFNKDIKVLMEKIKKISVNQDDIGKLSEEGNSIIPTNDILLKSQETVQKIRESLENMNVKITNKQKEYNKRKKLCYKALFTAYE